MEVALTIIAIIVLYTLLVMIMDYHYQLNKYTKGYVPKNPMPPNPTTCKPTKSETVYRVEVIGPKGRMYYSTCPLGCKPDVLYQDGGKTMKIFLK